MKGVLALFLILFLAGCSEKTTGTVEQVNGGTAVAEFPSPPPSSSLPTGSLYAIELDQGQQDLVQIDLSSSIKNIIFHTPDNGWLAGFDWWQPEAESGKFVLAYAPPPPEGEINFGFTGLYLLPADGAVMEPLLIPEVEQELFFDPSWSVDGTSIYYSHVQPLDPETYTFQTTLERVQLATGQIDLIAESSIWPRMSPDGTMLAYVQVQPETQQNSLMVADPDGENVRELIGPDQFAAVDAPIFTPDSRMIYFSAAEQTAARSWWEMLAGVEVASAHNLPSDWYRVPVAGGDYERLTETNMAGLYGRFAPQNAPFFAFASQEGIFQMNWNGDNLERWQEGTFTASLGWVP